MCMFMANQAVHSYLLFGECYGSRLGGLLFAKMTSTMVGHSGKYYFGSTSQNGQQ